MDGPHRGQLAGDLHPAGKRLGRKTKADELLFEQAFEPGADGDEEAIGGGGCHHSGGLRGLVPVADVLTAQAGQDVDGCRGAVAGADDRLAAARARQATDGVHAIQACPRVDVRSQSRLGIELEPELLREPRGLALRKDQKPRLDLLAALEDEPEAIARTRDALHPCVDDLGAGLLGLPAGDIWNIAAMHLRHTEIVLELREVHGGLVLAINRHLELVFRQKKRRAQAAGPVSYYHYV